MSIEQIIIDALSISKETDVPVLFFSNPGYGKTTILKRYAEKNGMHLETLIGSRFNQDEISGYQVFNGGDHLTHINPEWFSRIWKKKDEGIPTLLFIDELSTCSEGVQGSLLSLIFDRTIGSEKFLPKDCLIVAAANYSGNLSSYMNIMTPTLNRFLIINLNEKYGPIELIDEFLKTPEDPVYPVLKKLTDEQEDMFEKRFIITVKNLFLKYSDKESALGVIDVENSVLGDIYANSMNCVYNFISGRSLSYLKKCLHAYIEFQIKDKDFLYKMLDGLIGGGSYSFKEEQQEVNYRKFVHSEFAKLTKLEKVAKIELKQFSGDISKDIAAYMINKENLNTTAEEDLLQSVKIVEEVKEQFQFHNIFKDVREPEGIAKFVSDMEAIIEFQQMISAHPDARNICQELSRIAMDYYGIYCDITGVEMNFSKTFGIKNKYFQKVCFIKYPQSDGTAIIKRAALREPQNDSDLPCFYLIGNDESLLDAGLKKPLINSDGFRILIFDKSLKFIHIDKYIEKAKGKK